ncbi:LacI family DNA-binding transcriptional regulator [Parashewanella spongiae]|uniref:LacI family DNA-binding transcriptional regulator n=2 Tax=Parashewanella spongiae TaxID=342950 RepID=A0A3A6TI09_9GAMM|nr:LacI family DNA-binding transcriptional regulator [Parashewanella spongiae]MCL1079457.1 LacI family DNA-binding transcriptional regulator [Parashewanella spongiae]RJY07626.1 LacI family DNA-binding transcriptional regulator [Parashewanella spongiae]
MKVTIKDVASYAGVSIKTVSRVTNNEPSVKPSTVDKVNSAITALNYQPNISARNLAASHSFAIGFVYDNPNAYYIIDMQNGILTACNEKNYELIIHPCDSTAEDVSDQIISLIKRSRLAGVVLTPPMSEDPQLLSALDEVNANYVCIIAGNEESEKPKLSVLINDKFGAKQLTQHLINLNHQHIAFLCGDIRHKSSIERLEGYRQALKENNIKLDPDFIISGNYSFESGIAGTEQLVTMRHKPTAIVASNDEMAAGALFAARLAGINIPNELSIVGFENSPFSRQTLPKLTTVDQPLKQIAKVATEMLINNKHLSAQKYRIFTPNVVLRDSSVTLTKK